MTWILLVAMWFGCGTFAPVPNYPPFTSLASCQQAADWYNETFQGKYTAGDYPMPMARARCVENPAGKD
ncbi:MAG: hypothetical protein WAN11_25375 [Syntrophobacteraceae bacterium]